MSDKLIHTFV